MSFTIADLEALVDNPAPWTVTLRFGHSPSRQYERAVHAAKKNRSYECRYPDDDPAEEKSKKVVHAATFTEHYVFQKLYKLVRNWKSMELAMWGSKIDPLCFYLFEPCYRVTMNCSPGRGNFFGCWHIGVPETANRDQVVESVLRGCEWMQYCPNFPAREILRQLRIFPYRPQWNDVGYWAQRLRNLLLNIGYI